MNHNYTGRSKVNKTLYIIYTLIQISFISAGNTITQQEYFDMLIENHPLIKQENLSSKIENKNTEYFQGGQEWLFSGSSHIMRQNQMQPGAFSPDRVDISGLQFQMSRPFWNTGGRLSLSWATDFTNQHGLTPFSMALPVLDDNLNIIGVNSFDLQTSSQKFYQSNLRLIYSQPLLQNFKGTLDRLGMESSEISSDIADIQAIENQEDFLLINGLKFLDWVLLSEQKNIASERKELADLQYEQTVRKRESNLVDEIDVLRSKDAVLKADQIAMLITAQWKGLQAELAAIAQNPKILNSEPQFNLYSIVPLLTIEQGSKKLKSNSRLISALSKQQEIIGIQKIGSQELVKPQLYINSEIFLKNGDDSYNDALLPKETDYNLSLQLSFPMNNSSAKSRVAQNDLQVYQLELATQNVLLNLESALKNLLIQLEDFEQILEMNNLQIETARNKTDEELKRYNLGRGDLTFVIQSQDSEAQARLSYAQNAATYQALNLQVTALLDELLPQKIN